MSKDKFGISWALTADCNYRCSYCYRYTNEKIVSKKRAFQIVDHIYKMGCRKLSLAGGEPLLWHSKKEVFSLLAYIKSKGIITELITNGSLLCINDIPSLAKILDIITIDIDCLDNKVQTKLGRPGNHIQNATELFKTAKKCGIMIKTNTVVTPLNINLISKMSTFIKKNGFYKWKIYQFLPIIGFTNNKHDLQVNNKKFEKLRNIIEKDMSLSNTKLTIENNNQMSNSYININSNGVVHTNEICDNKLLLKHEIGEILSLNLEQIFNHFSFDKNKFLFYHRVS